MERRTTFALLYAAAAGLAVWGWYEYRFLTDDAFITFRYASNALAGRGFVWNPPPFLPVEGYTNFLWLLLLTGTWWATGLAPPRTANLASLGFALATLALVARALARMPLPPARERLRTALAAIVLLGIVSNRTWLVWSSSGLETALFGFAFVAWVLLALRDPGARTRAWAFALTSAAAAAALTRPDGWLAVLGSLALFALELRRGGWPGPARLTAWSPLGLPALHLLWRHATYGQWLPNSYYAKQLGPWPESGWRYAASFALEYALWFWALLVGIALLQMWRRTRRLRPPAHVAVALGVVVAHFLYYTLIVGGDHFEYRVYAHLVPLLLLAAGWSAARLAAPPAASVAALATFVALSWPIPWAHHFAAQQQNGREATHRMVVPVTPLLPAIFAPVARPFDTLQAWLIPRHVGMRHREHEVFLEWVQQVLPSREVGARIGWDDRPVAVAGNVRWLGWVLPNVAIIDMVGLNDYVVARTPPPDDGLRMMAHDRVAPPAYLACFRPNVRLPGGGRVEVVPRPVPLDDATIRACERSWRARAGEPIEVPPGYEIRR